MRKRGKQGKEADRGFQVKGEKGKKGRKGKQGKESDRGCHVKGEQGKQAKGKLIKKIQQPLA